jgi:hypothetical protein
LRAAQTPSVARAPAPFVGWPPELPRPEGLRDVQYAFHDPAPTHIGSSACSRRCVIEFSVDGDTERVWFDWLASLPRAGWTVTDERASQGTKWALMRSATSHDRFHVAWTGVDGGARGELRLAAPAATRAPSPAPVGCNPIPEPGRGSVRAVAWSFDLDRDGSLDAAALFGAIWVLFEVRGPCARAVGRPFGTLVRLGDETIGRDGWINVETDVGDGPPHALRTFEFEYRRGEYVETHPDAGVP